MKKISSFASLLVLLGGIFSMSIGHAAAAACTITANLGSVTGSFSIPVSGTYRVWSRMAAADSTNNSYSLEIDGNTCFQDVGDSSSIPTSFSAASLNDSVNWVDYQNGTTTTKNNITLTAGTHTYTAYGREAGVLLDRVVFSANASCVPTGFGDNCAVAPADVTAPTVNISSPANGATVSSTTDVTATATDNTGGSGVASVSFFIDSSTTAAATDTATPYTYSWPTGSVSNGSHTVKVTAVDAAGNTSTPATITVTVNNPVPDTTAPTTSITAPTGGATVTGTTTITANATDNTGGSGVARVDLYIDGSVVANDPSSPYSFSWNTTTYANGNHTLQTKAFDVAGNGPGVSPIITVNVQNTVTKTGDVNGDGSINTIDLSIILSNWLQSGKTRSQGDLSGDGTVNVTDLSILLSNWGK